VAAQRRLHAIYMAGEPWIEIDYPDDLAQARERVWPRISLCAANPFAPGCAVAAN